MNYQLKTRYVKTYAKTKIVDRFGQKLCKFSRQAHPDDIETFIDFMNKKPINPRYRYRFAYSDNVILNETFGTPVAYVSHDCPAWVFFFMDHVVDEINKEVKNG